MISILALSLLTATAADEVLARVGPDTITQSQLRERAAATRAQGGQADQAGLLEDLINDALLAQDGYKAGLARDPQVAGKVTAERARLAAELMMEKEINSAAQVTDEQLKELYHSSGDSVRYNLVVVATEEEAAAVLKRLRGGASFATEAARSLDPTGVASRGDSGSKNRGQLQPALATAVFAAPLRAFIGPIKLELGFGVAQVVGRQVASEAGLEARRPDLRRFMEKQLKMQYRQHYVEQLRAAEKVAVDEAFLRSTETRLQASADELDKAIATVGGRPIRYRDVLEILAATVGSKEGGHFSGLAVKLEFAWTLVDRALLEAAAIKRGFGSDPAVEAKVRRFEAVEVARANARRLRTAVATPAPKEIEAWYGKHQPAFATPASRTCAHIVVADKAQAEQLRTRVTKGETFEQLARAHSLDTRTAAAGGVLGVVGDDRVAELAKTEPRLAEALKGVRPNELSAPTESKLGWHLVRCGASTPAGRRPLPEVRELIVAQITAERATQAVQQHLEKLRAAAAITRDVAALSRTTPKQP